MNRSIIAGAATILFCASCGRAIAADAAKAPSARAKPPVEQVIIAFKTHFDIGYTEMAANVVQRYRTTMIDQALAVCDQSRGLPDAQKFAWTIPGWPMKKILDDWPGQTDERRRRVVEAFQSGRFVVHALPFTTHTELLEAEDLVRGLGFASQVSRAAGRPLPRDAKMTDVPCHSWIVPTLLRHANIDFLHLGCNAGSTSPVVPTLFWWEGPDGSRLLTMYTAESYGTGLVPPANWPHKTWLALIHTGDNHGPPTPDEVKRLLAEADRKLPGMKVRIGRLADFADAILAERPELPVVRADMPDTWIHGPMCDPAGAQVARTIRPVIAATESLNSTLRLWGVDVPDASAAVRTAYENSLLYGEHTWGGALAWVAKYSGKSDFPYGDAWKQQRAAGRFRRIEESWEEHSSYIRAARDAIAPVSAANLQALAAATAVEGPRIVVYNPLPWPRGGLVTVKAEVPQKFNAAKPADAPGAATALQVAGGTCQFLASDVPAMGYRTYQLTHAETPAPKLESNAQAGTIDNRFLKVALDPTRGTIRSLIDKRSGRELIDSTQPHGFGQYLYERFDADQTNGFVNSYGKIRTDWVLNEFGKPGLPTAKEAPYRAASPAGFKVRFEKTPVAVAAVMEAAAGNGVPHAVTTRVVLHDNRPCCDVEITLHDKPADPWPEAGWLCLPVKAEQPQFRLGRLGSIIDPVKDTIPGTNRHLFAINSGLAILDGQGHGLGLCPIDHPLVSLDVPGCWKFSKTFLPQRPVAYVNLFNNQWTTNFRFWNEGTWTSRVRVWAVDPYDAESALIAPCDEARFPLMAAAADGRPGKLPPQQAGVELSRRGVLVTAFGRNPDGEGIVLRLWEQAGVSETCEVRLPAGIAVKSVQPIDLRGEVIGKPISVTEGRFTVPLRAFAPATILIQR